VGHDVTNLLELAPADVPAELRADYYFDFDAHPFEHAELFRGKNARSVIDTIAGIGEYAAAQVDRIITNVKDADTWDQERFEGRSCGRFTVVLEEGAVFEPAYVVGGAEQAGVLHLGPGAKVLGANIWLNEGNISIGAGSMVEPGAGLKGPTLVGRDNEIRQGSYFRGNVILGNGCTVRGEIKNAVLMDRCDYPHPSYLGDSLCGYRSHFGNQATSANLKVFDIVERKNIAIELDGRTYDLGRRKVGIVMGDCSQVGCNSVSDPGVFLAPWVIVYQLTRLKKGFYGPDRVMKNKPLEHDVIEFAPLRRDKDKPV